VRLFLVRLKWSRISWNVDSALYVCISTSTTRWEWRLVSFNKKRVVDHLSFWIRINPLSNNPPMPLMISHVYLDHNPFSVRKRRNLQNHKFCSQPLYHEAFMCGPIASGTVYSGPLRWILFKVQAIHANIILLKTLLNIL